MWDIGSVLQRFISLIESRWGSLVPNDMENDNIKLEEEEDEEDDSKDAEDDEDETKKKRRASF